MSTPVIISSWLGDNNQTYGLLGLGFIASGATLPTTLTITAGASASFSVALAANVTLNINAAAGAGVTGAGGITPGSGGFQIAQGTFTPIFASGFDFPTTPFVHWSGASATLITAGRNGQGASPAGISNGLDNLYLGPATGLNGVVTAFAARFLDFGQRIVAWRSNNISPRILLTVESLGDGRLYFTLDSAAGFSQKLLIATTSSAPLSYPGFVRQFDEFQFYAFRVTFVVTIAPINPFQVTLTVRADIEVRVNNHVVWKGNLSSTHTPVFNADIPNPSLGYFSLCSTTTVYDDFYIDNNFLGDMQANSDDLTVTSFFSDPVQTQIVQEIYGLDPSDPEFTQVVMEVYGKRQRRFTFSSTKPRSRSVH